MQANTSATGEREGPAVALIITSNMSSSDRSSPTQSTKSGSIPLYCIVTRSLSATRPLLTPYFEKKKMDRLKLLYGSVKRKGVENVKVEKIINLGKIAIKFLNYLEGMINIA